MGLALKSIQNIYTVKTKPAADVRQRLEMLLLQQKEIKSQTKGVAHHFEVKDSTPEVYSGSKAKAKVQSDITNQPST